MRLTYLLASIIGLTTSIHGQKQIQDPTNNFYNNCGNAGCSWRVIQTMPRSIEDCSCNVNPGGSYPPKFLAAFYTQENYAGLLFRAYGYASYPYPTTTSPIITSEYCYRMPSFWFAKGGSMILNTVNAPTTPACWVFTNDDCTGYEAEVRNGVQAFQGFFENGVRSFVCF